MSNYFVTQSHGPTPHSTFASGEIEGACELSVIKNVMDREGTITPRPVFRALGQCACVAEAARDGSMAGAVYGSSADMYGAKAAINEFLHGHEGVNVLKDDRSAQFGADVVKQVVVAQMEGRLPLPGQELFAPQAAHIQVQ